MFGFLKKALGTVAKAAVPLAVTVIGAAVDPAMLINNVAAAAVKRKTPIKNSRIPVMNLVASSVFGYVKTVMVTGDWAGSVLPAVQTGITLAGGSTLLHQVWKKNRQEKTGAGT